MEVYAGQDQESEYDEEEFEVPHTPGWLASIEAGTRLEARDRTGWYEAKVIEVEEARVKIHYIGFAPKYDVWAERGLNWLRPRVVPKQSAHSKSNKSGHSASPADVELSAGRAALLEQVGKLKQTHFEPTGGYNKTDIHARACIREPRGLCDMQRGRRPSKAATAAAPAKRQTSYSFAVRAGANGTAARIAHSSRRCTRPGSALLERRGGPSAVGARALPRGGE
jgi:hypothetical protein